MTRYQCIPIYWKKNYYAPSPIWNPVIVSQHISYFFFFFAKPYCKWDLGSWQGIELMPPALENTVLTTGSPGNSLSADILVLSLFFSFCSVFKKKNAFGLQFYWKHFVFKTCNISLPTSETETTNHFTLQSLAEWLHSDAKCLISEFSCDTQGMTIK